MMDFKGANSLTSNEVRTNDKVVEDLLAATLKHLKLLEVLRTYGSCLSVTLLVKRLKLLHALLDLLGGLG